jgi:hypothetical protein
MKKVRKNVRKTKNCISLSNLNAAIGGNNINMLLKLRPEKPIRKITHKRKVYIAKKLIFLQNFYRKTGN